MNTHLLERLDSRLKEFISTEELPWGGGLSGGMDKPNYPSLYLSRSTDPGLMKLPGEGSAMVRYKVKRREIDESREDGQPLYGASIEIQEIEPVEEEEGVSEELASTLFLREFASSNIGALLKQADRSRKGVGKLMDAAAKGNRGAAMAFRKTKRKAIPMKDAKADGDFYARLVVNRGFGPSDELRMKRHYIKKAVRDNMQLSSTLFLRHFAEARDRDGEGRFAAGNVPGPQDYAIAQAMAKRKKATSMAGNIARNARGRVVM